MENCFSLGSIGGVPYWLVRTQAGFKKALAEWCSLYDEQKNEQEFLPGSSFPKSFPAVVSFRWEYQGHNYVAVTHRHVNAFRKSLAALNEKLNQADPQNNE